LIASVAGISCGRFELAIGIGPALQAKESLALQDSCVELHVTRTRGCCRIHRIVERLQRLVPPSVDQEQLAVEVALPRTKGIESRVAGDGTSEERPRRREVSTEQGDLGLQQPEARR